MSQIYTDKAESLGGAWASQAGASESDSLKSKLVDSPFSESLTRCANGPAWPQGWHIGGRN